MLNKERDLKDINLLLGSWIAAIRLNKAIKYLDINKVSEGFALKLLNLLFGYDLLDLNEIVADYEGLDLGNFDTSKIAFQVTSRIDTAKVISSLKTITDRNDHLKFTGGIKFLILREGEKIKFPKKTSDPTTHLPTFDKAGDILYPEHLTKRISDIYESDDFATFLKIKKLIERELQLVPKELLDTAESSLQEVKTLFDKTLESISGLQQSQRKFDYSSFLTADFPDLVVRCQREKLREKYIAQLEQSPIFWLCGVSGTGKSSLAYLLGKNLTYPKYWVDFREISLTELTGHLISSLNNSLGIKQGPISINLAEIMDAIGQNGLIVLNDLPDVSQSAKINNLMIDLAKHAIRNNVKVVVTSNFSASLNLKDQINEHFFQDNIPLFSDEETGDIMASFGAPTNINLQYRKHINLLSEGYPVIINSIANYLLEKNWEMDTEVINNIFKNDYNDQLNHEIYNSVITSTEDDDTLNLLYRCREVIGNFGPEELEIIAGVLPAIPLANQKFEKIKGIWVQRTQMQKFQLSPLIKRLHSNLSPELVKVINNALGEGLVKKKTLNQLEVAKAIQYFINGESLMDAAVMLIEVLRESLERPEIFFEWGFNLYWFYTEIPNSINAPTRLFIRFLQINVCIAADEEYDYLLQDVKYILANEKVDPKPVGLTQMLFYQLESKTDPISAMGHLIEAYKNLPLQELFNNDDETENELKFESSIWLPFCGCKTEVEYSNWFSYVKNIDFPEGQPDPKTNQAYVAAGLSLYVNLIEKNSISDLQVVQQLLIKIVGMSLESKFYLIAAYALRNIIIIFCTELQAYEAAESLVATYEPMLAINSIYKFLVYDELGRQFIFAGDQHKAVHYLGQVIDTELPDYFAEKVTTYRMFAQLTSETEPNIAHTYTLKALDFVEAHGFFLPIEKVKIHGEAGISYWLAGDLEQAVEKLEHGYDLLNKIFDNSPEHQAQIIRYGSTANYIIHLMRTGTILKEAETGTYAIPQRGSFYFTNEKLLESGLYNTERRYMGAHVFQVAYEFLGNYEMARKWALNCIQIMMEVDDPRFAILLHGSLFYLVNDREYGKALNVANYIKTHYKPFRSEKLNSADQEIQKVSEKIGRDDIVFYTFLFVPILFKVIIDVIEGTIVEEDYERLVKDLFEHPELMLSDTEAFAFLKDLFTKLLFVGIDDSTLESIFIENTGDYMLEFKVIAYLMAGLYSTAKEAAQYQLRIVNRFENLYVDKFSEIMTLLIVPFFENFWLEKAKINNSEFYDFAIWETQSIPKFREEKGINRIKKIFQTLNYHLDLEIPANISNWIKSK